MACLASDVGYFITFTQQLCSFCRAAIWGVWFDLARFNKGCTCANWNWVLQYCSNNIRLLWHPTSSSGTPLCAAHVLYTWLQSWLPSKSLGDLCWKDKHTRSIFPSSDNRASASSNLICCNICGPYWCTILTSAKYFFNYVELFQSCYLGPFDAW